MTPGWQGAALRVASDWRSLLERAPAIARTTNTPAWAIVHDAGNGRELLVASEDPEGSGLPIISRAKVSP